MYNKFVNRGIGHLLRVTCIQFVKDLIIFTTRLMRDHFILHYSDCLVDFVILVWNVWVWKTVVMLMGQLDPLLSPRLPETCELHCWLIDFFCNCFCVMNWIFVMDWIYSCFALQMQTHILWKEMNWISKLNVNVHQVCK